MSDEARKPKSRSAVGIGLTTLVTVMVIVLLTTFSVLTLVSAHSDLNLTTKALQATSDYYAADTEAEQWLATLDATIQRSWDEAGLNALDANGYHYVLDTEGEGCLVTQTFAIGSNRQLSVEIAVSGEGDLTVIKWQSGPLDNGL
jgi:hypothetical protein